MRPISPRRLRRAARLGLSLLLALSLAGLCGGCGKPAPQPMDVKPQAPPPKPKVQVEEPAAQEELYAYSSAGKPDPFRPFGVGRADKRAKRHISPLQQMDLGQFRLVGIADSPAGMVALVQDGTGRGYVLRRGTEIGSAGGVVREITLDGVKVEEHARDYAGRLLTKTLVLKLVEEEQ